MKVSTKAALQTIGAVIVGFTVVLTLDFISPKYGILIWMFGLMAYIMYCLYKVRVSMLEREQDKIVDILKE